MPKEYQLMSVIGLFVIGYLLDAAVPPLDVVVETPYHFFTPEMLAQVPFSTASIMLKAIALMLTPVVLFSFFEKHFIGKAALILVMSSLLQLYAIQDNATQARLIPQEWSLGFTGAGILLLIPFVWYMFRGLFSSLQENVSSAKLEQQIREKSQAKATPSNSTQPTKST